MGKFLTTIFLLSGFHAFGQRTVTGCVRDFENIVMPGVAVIEKGTENSTSTDIRGKFRFITAGDSCQVIFSSIGFHTAIAYVTGDTTLNITLDGDWYDTKLFTAGLSYDAFNPTLGLLISNGYNEHPVTHFEDFSESWIYKLYGSTDFGENYSFGFKFAHDYAFRIMYMPAVEFRKFEYPSGNIHFTDINLSTGFGFRRFRPDLLFKTGYQSLNAIRGFGAGAGLQMRHSNIYYGFLMGYWANYFTYDVYIQSFIYKHMLSLRAEYERIGQYSFLNLGVNFTFYR